MDHDILCQKIHAMGVCSTVWFRSYLKERNQAVNINGTLSKPRTVTRRVPQGSILGHLLFLCYVNDIPTSVRSRLIQCADDSAIIASDIDLNKIVDALSTDLENCEQWLIE